MRKGLTVVNNNYKSVMYDKRKRVYSKKGFDFRFNPEACIECQGRCCNGSSGNIFVNSEEIKAISRFLGIEFSKFMEEYLIKVSYKFSIKEIKTDKNYACIFFDKKGTNVRDVDKK